MLRSASTARALSSAAPQADGTLFLDLPAKREGHGEPPRYRALKAPPELSARRSSKPTAPLSLNQRRSGRNMARRLEVTLYKHRPSSRLCGAPSRRRPSFRTSGEAGRTWRAAPKSRSASTARAPGSAAPQPDGALLLEPAAKREEHGEPSLSCARQAPPELSALQRSKPTAPFVLTERRSERNMASHP